jgi:Sec-independent protein translocase protein TatA
MLVLAVTALLVPGPRKLAEVGRGVGRGLRELRQAIVAGTRGRQSTSRDRQLSALADSPAPDWMSGQGRGAGHATGHGAADDEQEQEQERDHGLRRASAPSAKPPSRVEAGGW